MPPHIRLQSSTVTPISFCQQLHMKRDRIGWTRHQHNFGYAALMMAAPFKSHALFKARALGLSLLQPKREWVYLCFQYYSRCWNPPSPGTQFTIFLSLPPIPNILRTSCPSFTRFYDTRISSNDNNLGTKIGQDRSSAYHGEMDVPRPPESAVVPLASASSPLATHIRGQ